MIDLLYFALSGIVFGTLAGLIPGFGLTATMAMVGFWFATNNAIDILTFYIGMLCASQYVGSMMAIGFGVPGESSSMPAVREGHPLFKQGKGSIAIGTTAISSFLGSIISVAIFFSIIVAIQHLLLLWNNSVQVVIYSIAIFLVCTISDNKWWQSLLMVLLGLHFGLTGHNYGINWDYATFNQPWLYSGLPMIPLVLGLFVVPELWKANQQSNAKITPVFDFAVVENFKLCLANWWVITYSSVMGFVCGLVPTLTTRLASNLSWMVQKQIEVSKQRYTPGNLNCLVSAETSNNAATFSVLLPLLLLGIPITSSEFIVYEFMLKSYDDLNVQWVFDNSTRLLSTFFLVNVVCLIIAWPLASNVMKVAKIPKKYLAVILTLMIVFPVVYTGHVNGLLTFYIGSFVFFVTLGLILRKYDTMPIVFAFLISNQFVAGFVRFYQIHF